MLPLGSEFLYLVSKYYQDIVELFLIAAVAIYSVQELLYIVLHISYKFYDPGFLLGALFGTGWVFGRVVCVVVVDILLEIHWLNLLIESISFKLLLALF
jgi:hypothetical protein